MPLSQIARQRVLSNSRRPEPVAGRLGIALCSVQVLGSCFDKFSANGSGFLRFRSFLAHAVPAGDDFELAQDHLQAAGAAGRTRKRPGEQVYLRLAPHAVASWRVDPPP